MLEEEDEEENMDTPLVESDGIDGAVGDIGGGGRVVLEVVVGVLTAFTLLLLCLFLGLLFAYSRRQKTGGGDSSSCRRSLNPFPAAAQVNMKDLLLTLSPSGHHGLASLAQQQQPNTSSSSSGAPSASSSSSSSNNNKANITPNPGYYSFAAPDASEDPPLLLTRLQQQQEQKERLFLQQQQQRHFSEEARARWHSTGNVDGLFDLEDEVGAAMPPSIVVADLLEGGGGGGGGGFGGVAEYACVDVQVKFLRKEKQVGSDDKNMFLHLYVGFWRPSSPVGRQHGPLPPRRPRSGRHLVHLRLQPGEPLLQRAAAAAAGTTAAAASAALRHPADDKQAVEAAPEAEPAEQGAAPAASSSSSTAAADSGIRRRRRQREEPLRLRLRGPGPARRVQPGAVLPPHRLGAPSKKELQRRRRRIRGQEGVLVHPWRRRCEFPIFTTLRFPSEKSTPFSTF